MARAALRALIAVVVLAGCKATTIDEHPCPPSGTKLTYASFGAPFLGAYCQRCHGAPPSDRQGAPSSFDFGTQADVQAHADRIFERSAADNTTMPPGPDDPPREERDKLAEWLACGAP